MKNILFSIGVLLLTLPLSAQSISARISYEETVTIKIKSGKDSSPETQALLSQLPSSFSNRAELVFNPDASFYTRVKESEKKDVAVNNNRTSIKFSMGSVASPDSYYINIKNKTTKQQRSIFDRQFFVEDDLPKIQWTIGKAEKIDETSALSVKQATGITPQGDTITAWYTPNIPVSIGPKDFGGLPGLIVTLVDNRVTYQIKNIEFLSTPPVVTPPFEDEKTMTLEKFYALQSKKKKALRKGNQGNITIFGG